jgi:hypothetical protein
MASALPLSAYPFDNVVLTCRRCGLRGRFDKEKLIERAGPDASLPTIRLRLAEVLGCERAKAALNSDFLPGFEQCGAHYPDLLIQRR